MSNVDNFHILPEQEELFFKSCAVRPGFWGTKIDKKNVIYRIRNFKDLVDRSVFPDIATAWDSLTDYQKNLWTSAGSWAGKSGWDLFAQDMAYRLANQISGIGEPSIYHQFKVGHIYIPSSANILQIDRPVVIASQKQFEFSFNYMMKMTAKDASAYCAFFFYFEFYDVDEWILVEEDLYIDPTDRWYYASDYYDFGADQIQNGFIRIEVYHYYGDLYFDGISLLANGQNLVPDWQCDNILVSWNSTYVPTGARIESLYSRNEFYYNY